MECSHCGYDADPEEGECPLCGTPLEGRSGGPARVADASRDEGSDAPPAGSGGEAAGRTPWEAAGGPGGLVDSWWESLSDPKGFFARVDWEGGLERPLLYYLVFVVVGAAFGTVWYAILGSPAASLIEAESVELLGGDDLLLQFFLTPFTALLSLAVTALAAHAGVRMLADRPRPIRATARSLCYAAGPQVVLAVPRVGGVVAFFWSLFIVVVGLREAHGITSLRAAGAVVVAFLLLTTFLVGMAVLVVSLGMTGLLPIPGTS